MRVRSFFFTMNTKVQLEMKFNDSVKFENLTLQHGTVGPLNSTLKCTSFPFFRKNVYKSAGTGSIENGTNKQVLY